MTTFRFDSMNPVCKTEALRRLIQVTGSQGSQMNPKWVPNLPQHFAETGLADTQSDVREMPANLAYYSHECNLMIFESLARQSQNIEFAKAVGELMPEVVAETKKGAWLAWKRWTVVGKKGDDMGS